jgi:hypothetical protein
VDGPGELQGDCDGTTQSWTVVVEPESGSFTDGKLKTTRFSGANTLDIGTGYWIKQNVKLSTSNHIFDPRFADEGRTTNDECDSRPSSFVFRPNSERFCGSLH